VAAPADCIASVIARCAAARASPNQAGSAKSSGAGQGAAPSLAARLVSASRLGVEVAAGAAFAVFAAFFVGARFVMRGVVRVAIGFGLSSPRLCAAPLCPLGADPHPAPVPDMWIVALAWFYVVLLMALAEATSATGTVLGAIFTLVGYGMLPLGLVLYLMGTPGRRRRRRAEEAAAGSAAVAAVGQADGGGHAAGDAVAAKREEA
jgi:hypothetical protein